MCVSVCVCEYVRCGEERDEREEEEGLCSRDVGSPGKKKGTAFVAVSVCQGKT